MLKSIRKLAAGPAKPVLILQTGDVPAGIDCENFDRMFLRRTNFGPAGAVVVHAARQAPPAEADPFAGVVITGSPAMVTDREPWSERCADWLRRAAGAGAALLGVCYGHQLLAHAFGGEVGYNPRGLELGTHSIRLRPEARRHPLFAATPDEFKAHLAHSQTVLRLPPGARALAASDHDPHQIILYSDRVVSFQFHPEYDEAVARAYVQALAGPDPDSGMGLPVEPTPAAAALLQRFIDHLPGLTNPALSRPGPA
ncbi:MAG: glutamine amidotransferase [Candidatus Adiutrix sp.]|jgi:GMP synthase (glutamine-hydrolysing)|nr:glutamine amidotransferase [Candidatus Adiutrix sp.]